MPITNKASNDEPQASSDELNPATAEENPTFSGFLQEIARYLRAGALWAGERAGIILNRIAKKQSLAPTVGPVHDNESQNTAEERALTVIAGVRPLAQYAGKVSLHVQHGVDIARSSLDSSAKRRTAGRMTAALLLLLILAPIITWTRYQSLNVMSTNAIVRGHVTEIGTRLNGVVRSVAVDAGDRVYAGQVLVKLEDRHFLAEAQEARALLDGLNQELEVEKLEIDYERQQLKHQLAEATANLSAAKAESAAAKARAENARRSHEVRRSLYATGGAISGEDVRESESNKLTTEALMRASEAEQIAASSARTKTSLSGDALNIRERKIGILEAEIARAEAALSKAEADLDGATIRAPQDGAIVRRIVQAGGSVDVGQPIIGMWLGNEVWVEAWVDEEDISDVRPGNKATITLLSFRDQEFIGTVEKLGLTTDFAMPETEVPQPRFSRMRGTPVVGVRIKLDDPPAGLLPGLSAVVSIRRSGG